jgi:diacylglycerol kinase family enzyme
VWRADDRYFTNYLSIGLDAAVSANFHLRRQLGLFPTGSVLGNKATYAMYAMGSLGRRIRGSRAELILADGSRAHLDLRGSTALILSNVPSYGGGTLPACGICCNDGLLQAVVIRSPWSLAGLFLVHGLLPWCKSAYAARLECLAVRRAILHLEQDEFLQTDGEPRLEMAGRSIVVERAGCVRVLRIAT